MVLLIKVKPLIISTDVDNIQQIADDVKKRSITNCTGQRPERQYQATTLARRAI